LFLEFLEGRFGDHVHDAARRDLAIEKRSGPLDDFNALGRVEAECLRPCQTVAEGIGKYPRAKTAQINLGISGGEAIVLSGHAWRITHEIDDGRWTNILDKLRSECLDREWQILDRRIDA